MITQNAPLGYKDVTSLNVTQDIDRKDSKKSQNHFSGLRHRRDETQHRFTIKPLNTPGIKII